MIILLVFSFSHLLTQISLEVWIINNYVLSLVSLMLPASLFQALDTFNAAIVAPVYYVMFTTLTIIASVIMFKVDFLIYVLGFPSDALICYLFVMQL